VAVAFLNFAGDILDEFDVAVKASLQFLKELDDSPLSFSVEFLQNESTKLFFYTARFFGRAETLESLQTQDSNIAGRLDGIQSRLSEAIERMADLSVRVGDDAENQSVQDEIVAENRRVLPLLNALHAYTIASDFANAAQWLKVYEGLTSLEEMIEQLASNRHPLLLECFETLSNLPKMRLEVEKLKHKLT
jgi:hypothetical protein